MEKCLCGSGKNYNECCARFIEGGNDATSAEELLRSRYVAHALKKVDYIIDTVHASNTEDKDRATLVDWLDKSFWHGLNIIEIDRKRDDLTFIEFTAESTYMGKKDIHRELSEFRKEDGKWFFYTGKTPNVKQVVNKNKSVGANDPCPCGSGKKFKKCCMGK